MIQISVITKLRHIFPRTVKVKLIVLVVSIIIGALIETWTLSLIQPFTMILADPSVIYSNEMLYRIYNILGFGSVTVFLASIAVAVAALYTFRGIYVYFLTRLQNRFLATNTAILSNSLLIHTLKQPYLYHVNNNPSKLQQTVIRNAERLYGVVNCSLLMLVDGFMTLFILVFLMVTSFHMTMVVLLFAGISTVTYFKIFKRRIKAGGDDEAKGLIQINKSVLQALHGVKEIKIARREKFFTDKFKTINFNTVRVKEKVQSIRQLPKLFMESLCFSGAFLLVATVITAGVDMQTLIPQLGMFMLAAFKLLPAVSRILNNITQIMRHGFSVHEVFSVLHEKDEELEQSMNSLTVSTHSKDIVACGVTFKYPNTRRPILVDTSFSIPHNTSVGIIGASGSGKSTLVDIVLGILCPQEGIVTYNGKSIHNDFNNWAENIGYVPQVTYLMDETLMENVAFGIEKNKIDIEKVWHALEQAQLKEFVESLPDSLETEIGEMGSRLSGGQRQRIGIARALYDNPEILVFDEATSALDYATESAVMAAIRELQDSKTMLIISHRLSTIEHCDIVYKVKKGQVIKVREPAEIGQV